MKKKKEISKCPKCDGSGYTSSHFDYDHNKLIQDICIECDGTGKKKSFWKENWFMILFFSIYSFFLISMLITMFIWQIK